MDLDCLENIIEDCGINMIEIEKEKIKDKEAFDSWFAVWKDVSQEKVADEPTYIEAFAVWKAAISHERNKTIRTYRWDGVIR